MNKILLALIGFGIFTVFLFSTDYLPIGFARIPNLAIAGLGIAIFVGTSIDIIENGFKDTQEVQDK